MYMIVLFVCVTSARPVNPVWSYEDLTGRRTARKNDNFLEKIYDILRYKNKVDLNISACRGVLLHILYNVTLIIEVTTCEPEHRFLKMPRKEFKINF